MARTMGRGQASFSRMTAAFDRGFERLRDGYAKNINLCLRRRAIVPVVAVLILGLALAMLTLVGRDLSR